jgi:tetratricopeptide (TPR) repeat protein
MRNLFLPEASTMLSRKTRFIIKTAATAVFLIAPLSFAQQRVGDEGRALDASNRVGSGGYNSGPITGNVLTGNNIVTGNVTGGREFRGGVPYTDPREFRGNVGGQDFDRFIAGSSGAPTPYAAPTNFLQQPQPFYGQRLANQQAPQGFAEQGATGIYVPKPTTSNTPFDNRIETRLEAPKPSDLLMAGPVDPETNLPTMLSASPLLGVRQWKSTDPEDRDFLRSFSPIRQDSALDRLRMDPLLIKQYRDELSTEVDEKTGEKIEDKRPGLLNNAVQQPFETPQNDPQRQRINGLVNDKPLPGEVRAEGTSFRRVLLPPVAQSTQYAELERRLRRYYEDRLVTDEDKNREYLKQLRARDAADKNNTAVAGRNPGALALPDYARIGQDLANQQPGPGGAQQPAPGVGAANVKPQPIKITSLAAGVKAEGLAKLLKNGEDLMKEGKFGPALDQYQAAAQLAPNNGLVLLGQANAELAIGFYRKAEQHIRMALRGDPVLLMAQLDLKGMLGEEKLNAVVRDLKEIAFKQEQDAGVAVLLAYIAYNTGNEQSAAMYLDLAQKRSNARDDFPKILRQHWNIPQTTPATQPAK